MDFLDFAIPDSPWFTYLVLPVLIFLARICDQSIGTLRVIFVSKGMKYIAPILGFFESLIWLLAIGQIMQHLDNFICIIAYTGGYAAGNYVGIWIEEKISLGNVIIRVIPRRDTTDLLKCFKDNNIGFTCTDAIGSTGNVKVIFSIAKRKDAPNIIALINEFNPNAFYTVEEVKSVQEGIFPARNRRHILRKAFGTRKSK